MRRSWANSRRRGETSWRKSDEEAIPVLVPVLQEGVHVHTRLVAADLPMRPRWNRFERHPLLVGEASPMTGQANRPSDFGVQVGGDRSAVSMPNDRLQFDEHICGGIRDLLKDGMSPDELVGRLYQIVCVIAADLADRRQKRDLIERARRSLAEQRSDAARKREARASYNRAKKRKENR